MNFCRLRGSPSGILSCLGAILASISIGIKIAAPTNSSCYAELWLTTLGYTLLFASLFVRTYRIDRCSSFFVICVVVPDNFSESRIT
jgi:hypothetical protein